MRSTTRMAAAAAGVVLMAGLTACGGSGGGGGKAAGSGGGGSSKGADQPSGLSPALQALQLASQETGKEHSAKVDGTMAMGGLNQSMKGEMDWAGGMRANLSISTPLSPGKAMDARYTPDAMYMNMGAAMPGMPLGGKSWVKYSYDTLAQKGGASGAVLKDQMQNNNPTRSVDLIIASGQVKEVGKESVRGASATHYSGTLNVADLAKMQSKNLSKQDLDALQKQLQLSGTQTETIDLWVDDHHLLVKKQEQAQTKSGAMNSTVFYSDYGTQVTVTPPPASDTVDMAQLPGQQQPQQ